MVHTIVVYMLSLYSIADPKSFVLGPGIGVDPQRHNSALPIPTCWYMYLQMLKFAFPPTPNLKFALPPTRTPNASQWNMGCVGSPTQNFTLAMYISFLLVDFICIWWSMQTQFPVEYGLYAILSAYKMKIVHCILISN